MFRVLPRLTFITALLVVSTLLSFTVSNVSGTSDSRGAVLQNFSSGLDACTPPVEPVDLTDPTIITQCDQAGIQAALDQGGHISFDCGSDPVTIPLSEPLVTSATEDTVIDGGGLITLDGQNTTRILEKPFTPGSQDEPVGNDLTIQHMRFINGQAPAATKNKDGNARGGALTATSPGTHLHIINSTFENNATTSPTDEDNQGGAIYASGVYETVIVGSIFQNNVAGNGGAFGGIATGLIIYNSHFSANQATDASDGGIVRGHGGAIHLDGVTNSFNPQSNRVVDVCGSEFIDNTAVRGGGAFKVTVSDNKGTKATYQRSTFRNNRLVQVPPTEGSGGAIYHIEDDFDNGTSEDNIEIRDSTFEGNYAYKQGGAVWLLVRGNGRIVNSTFTRNEASEANSNRVGQGGAVIISKGIIDIVNTTFASNFATFQGGAVFAGASGDPERQVTLINALFSQNHLDPNHDGTEYQGYHTNRPLTNGGGNLQFPRDNNKLITEPETAILFANPKLEDLADNDGPTQTMALPDESPAIDAGTSTGCPETDQRGKTRPYGSGCDIGSYEWSTHGPVLKSIRPSIIETGATEDFTLTASGENFTENSVIRWNSEGLPTTFVSELELTTTISASMVSGASTIAITVYDPTTGEETAESEERLFRVVDELHQIYLPLVNRM